MQQIRILQVLSSVNGYKFYSEFIPKVKTTLFPEIWIEDKRNLLTGIEVKHYGYNTAEKNAARVTISKAITRLMNRGLIEQRCTGSSEIRIFLTPSGHLLVNEYDRY